MRSDASDGSNYYGTAMSALEHARKAGHDLLLDIDVQGAATIRKTDDAMVRDSLVDVFIMPPTIEELERKLAEILDSLAV